MMATGQAPSAGMRLSVETTATVEANANRRCRGRLSTCPCCEPASMSKWRRAGPRFPAAGRHLIAKMYLAVAVLVVGWAVLGSPRRSVADLIWPDGPAPWETIEALYYPDKTDLRHSIVTGGLHSLADCRTAVRFLAWRAGDEAFERGDYACGIGIEARSDDPLAIYRVIRR